MAAVAPIRSVDGLDMDEWKQLSVVEALMLNVQRWLSFDGKTDVSVCCDLLADPERFGAYLYLALSNLDRAAWTGPEHSPEMTLFSTLRAMGPAHGGQAKFLADLARKEIRN